MLKQIKTLIALVMGLMFVSSALAQDSFTFAGGKLSVTLPAGWQAEDSNPYAILSNTLEGLEIGRNGDNARAGSIVVLMAATADIEELGGDANIAPATVIEIFLGASGMNGTPVTRSINGFDLVFAQVTSLELDLEDIEAAVMALETANGTVFALINTGDTLAQYDAELESIYESLTSAAPNAAATDSATDSGLDIAAILGETASKQFGDGTVMNYPISYTASESDNTRVELTSPEGSIIRHEAIKRYNGVGETPLKFALVDAFGSNSLDPTRLIDVFGDGSVLQYQVGPRDYFITFIPFTDTTKLLVVSLSETASEEANQAALAVAQAIAADMSLVKPSAATASTESDPAADSNVLTYGSSVSGTLNDSTPEIYYTFSGTQGDVVTITMIADNTSALDTWVWLYTSEGFEGEALVPLIDNDDAEDASVGAPNSQIKDFTLPETGEYSIRATRLGTGAGDFTLSLTSPNAAPAVTDESAPAAEAIRQWAKNASATSEYGNPNWAAVQATGAPDAGDFCIDNSKAWASATTGGKESLTLIYETAVIPSEINIYQVYNPGSITEVVVMNSRTGNRVSLPNSADPVGNTPCPGVFTIPVSGLSDAFDIVTIYLDQSSVTSWTEIDAVELVGADPASVTAPAESASGSAANTDTSAALAVLGADAVQHSFSDGAVFTYPASYEVYLADDRNIQIAGYKRKVVILYDNNRTVAGQGQQAMLDLVKTYYPTTESLDPSRLVDLFNDGSALRYQPTANKYFVIFNVADGLSKLVVVDTSMSATEETIQKGMADVQAIVQLMLQR